MWSECEIRNSDVARILLDYVISLVSDGRRNVSNSCEHTSGLWHYEQLVHNRPSTLYESFVACGKENPSSKTTASHIIEVISNLTHGYPKSDPRGITFRHP